MHMTPFRSCPGGALPAAAALTVLALVAPALAQCPATFTVGPAWPMGNPYSVSVGDFNNDGLRDVAAANFSGANATVRLQNQFVANDFSVLHTYPLNLNPRGSQAADFNRDGRSDLAVAYMGGGVPNARLAVMLANANGTLAAPVLYPLPAMPYDVEVADVNGDGFVDALVITGNDVSIFRGNGDGTFQAATVVAAGVQPSGLAVTDVNGDGTPDLVTTRYSDPPQVRVSLGIPGSGGLGYAAFVPYTVAGAWGPWGIEAGDFNNDGRSDVAVTHRITNRVGVLLGNADGSLTPLATAQPGVQPQDVAVADFNGDGRLDVAVGNWGGSNVSVLLGDGAGGLTTRSNFTVGANVNGVRVADMNNDGKTDIVVANQAGGAAQILYNTTPVTAFNLTPFDRRVCPGATTGALFFARATTTQAGGLAGYRWERLVGGAWQQLNEGHVPGVGVVSFSGGTNGDPTNMFVGNVEGEPGAHVATIRPVALTACGATPGDAVDLSIIAPCGGADVGATGGVFTGCGDGVLDNNDFVVFIDLFFTGNAIADVGSQGGVPGADGRFDNNDFVVFIDMFFSGCTT
ncbi:MAG TPA: VCBS repeat-containing protein [Phycisphaerales bacterium]|nr:VCBS repeat-containing protein [Phycisphaerales bacterium]